MTRTDARCKVSPHQNFQNDVPPYNNGKKFHVWTRIIVIVLAQSPTMVTRLSLRRVGEFLSDLCVEHYILPETLI